MILNPSFLNELKNDTDILAERVAEGREAVMKAQFSAGPRSGTHHSGLPRRSSAPHEYPQEQSGQLVSDINSQPTAEPGVWLVGIFGNPYVAALELGLGSVKARNAVYNSMISPDAEASDRSALK